MQNLGKFQIQRAATLQCNLIKNILLYADDDVLSMLLKVTNRSPLFSKNICFLGVAKDFLSLNNVLDLGYRN